MFDGKLVLVCGATGLIGANLVARLLDRGARVRATLFRTPALMQDDRIEYVQADLTRAEDCARVVSGADYVFMCAANTSGAAVMAHSPLAHVTPNVQMNALLMQAAWEARVKKYCFFSSSAAYPPSGAVPVREDQMFEGDPYDVYFPVGWMKRYVEVLCRMYAEKIQSPMPTIVIRPSNVYGPYDKFNPKTSHVTAALIRRVAAAENPMDIWGTGGDIRDLIYIDDFIDGTLAVFEKAETYDAVNIASGTGVSVREVLELLLDIAGLDGVDVRYDRTKPQTIPVRLIDGAHARDAYGFVARTPLREGLERTLAWYKANRDTHPR